jgi:LytTr DNA-binding domain
MPADLHERTVLLHERPIWRFETDGWSASFPGEAAYEQVTLSSRPQLPFLDDLVARIDPRNSWTGYLIAAGTVLSIGLALSEPSASSGLGLFARIVFWLAHVASALFFFELAQITLGRIAMFERLPPLLLVVAVGVVGAVLFAIFNLLLLDRIAFLVGDRLDLEPISIPGLMEELRDSGATSVLFWVLLNSPRLLMIAQQKDADEAGEQPSAAVESSPPDAANPPQAGRQLLDLLSRLPRRIGTDIVAISAELHYLRVYTSIGEALILMSFGRAVEALAVIPGQAIHRSHWIALAHIVALESDGDRIICRLDTGLELPVSRTYRPSLRAALASRNHQRVLRAAVNMAPAPNPVE